MTTQFIRTAMAITIIVSCYIPIAIAGQARRTDARLLINEMTIVGMTEVQLGQMAAERAGQADIKAFGQMMVKDHTQANAELSRIAAESKIVPPREIDEKHADLVARLSKLNGAEFDRAYIAAMVEGHQAVATQLREWTTASRPVGPPPASDPKATDIARGGPEEEKLTEWAMRTLPTVEKHLDRARALQQNR